MLIYIRKKFKFNDMEFFRINKSQRHQNIYIINYINIIKWITIKIKIKEKSKLLLTCVDHQQRMLEFFQKPNTSQNHTSQRHNSRSIYSLKKITF